GAVDGWCEPLLQFLALRFWARWLATQIGDRVAVSPLSQTRILCSQAFVLTPSHCVRLISSPSVKFRCPCPVLIPHAHWGLNVSFDVPRPHPKNARRWQKLPVLRRSGTEPEPEHQTNSCRASPFRAASSKGFGRCCTGHKGNQIIQRERSAPRSIDWMTASGGRRVPEETTMLENFYETCADNGLTT